MAGFEDLQEGKALRLTEGAGTHTIDSPRKTKTNKNTKQTNMENERQNIIKNNNNNNNNNNNSSTSSKTTTKPTSFAAVLR